MRFVFVFVTMIFFAAIFQMIAPDVHWLIRGVFTGVCFSAGSIVWSIK